MKKISTILSIILIICLAGCKADTEKGKITVSVSIPPQAHFIEKICGDKVNIVTMIPAGASAEKYEPDFKEISAFSESTVYFAIGVPAEKTGILPHLSKNTKLIELQNRVDKALYPDIKIGKERDPHIWLSVPRVIDMVSATVSEMKKIDPENAELYERNGYEYIKELEDLSEEISLTLKKRKTDTFFISHPSYGYFAKDYSLNMLALEENGHEVTPKRLATLTDMAKKEKIKHIFCQEEASKNQAELFAKEIGGKVEILTPLAEDYEKSMRKTANLIAEAIN